MIFKTYIFKACIAIREKSLYSGLLTSCIGIVLLLSCSTAYATYPPTFSDCIHGDGEEYDQVDACKQLIRSNSKRRELHVALGKTLDKRQRHIQAVKAYQNALQIFPRDDYFENKLTIAKSNLQEKKWLNDKNKIGQSSALSTASKDTPTQFQLKKIKCTRLTGNNALIACKQAIKLNNKDADLYISQGDIFASQQQNKLAVASYENALKLNPNDEQTTEKLTKLITRNKTFNKENNEAISAKLSSSENKIIARKSTQAAGKSQAIYKKQLAQPKVVQKNVAAVAEKNTRFQLRPEQQKFLDKLNLLKSLKSQGIVSESEYQQRKKALIDANFRVISSSQSASSKYKKTKTIAQKHNEMLKGLKFGNYHALIIGNNQYKHLPVLETAVNDAQTLAKLLKTEYGFKVKLLLNASRYDTLKAMGELRRTLTRNDNLLIYYAGHGILDRVSERGYWLPVNAEQDFNANWISTAEITDTLKALQAWHVLVVADSCYSGTLVRSAPVKITTPEGQRSLFKRLLKKKSRTVITSGGLEPVTDSGGDNHSVFSQSLLDVLRSNTLAIEAEKVFSQLRDKVILNADQTPEYSDVRKVGHNGGDFIFLRQ